MRNDKPLNQLFVSDMPIKFQIQLNKNRQMVEIGPQNSKIDFVLIINSYRFIWGLLLKGAVMGLAEAYVKKQIDIRGDLISAIKIKNYLKPQALSVPVLLKSMIQVFFL